MKESLKEIFARIGHFGEDIGCNDKGGTHCYVDTYDKLFERFRNGCSFMELGLALGDSINLFDQYLENSEIVGVDLSIIFQPKDYKNKVTLLASDCTKPELLNLLGDKKFDIILDDASHMEADQIASFELLKHRMNPGGLYIIEDILALDQNRHRFKALHPSCEIFDLRSVKNRFDDVIICYRF